MDKRTVVAIVLIGLILLISNTNFYRRFIGIPERAPAERVESETPQEEELEPETMPPPSPAAEKQILRSLEIVEPKEIHIESDLFRGIIDTRGGLLTSWEIKPRPEKSDTREWVRLLPTIADKGALGVTFPEDGGLTGFNQLVFRSNLDSIHLSLAHPRETLQLIAETEQGVRLEKEFIFTNYRHDFELIVSIDGASDYGSGQEYALWWKPGLLATEEKRKDDLRSFAVQTMLGDLIEKTEFKGNTLKDSVFTGDTKWIAIQTKYFLMAMIPPADEDGLGVEMHGLYRPEDKTNNIQEDRIISAGIRMPMPAGQCQHRWRIYLGPMDYFTLKDFHIGLERTVYLGRGVLRWIGLLILYLFVHLYQWIPNYGVVIIIFSIVVKGIFYPLTRKSMASIRKMQEIQPEIKKIQEKYKKDPAKLQKATMELYRKYSVNPASGCFPLLLQMPVFFALYAVFRNTIELRKASFLWVKDLSAPDAVLRLPFEIPFYGDHFAIMPVIMAVTMFVQQKMSMKDPKQAYMVYAMPLFLFFLFNNISSGLVLYWTMFNVLQIIQESIHPHKPMVLSPEKEAQ